MRSRFHNRSTNKVGGIANNSGETSEHQGGKNSKDEHRPETAIELQPKRVQDTDLVLIRRTCVIDQFKDHSRTNEGNRHRHKDQGFCKAAPFDAVGQLRNQQPERGRRGRHNEEPKKVVAHRFPEFIFGKHATVVVKTNVLGGPAR